MGEVGSFRLALRSAERESHLKCRLQSNPEGEERMGGEEEGKRQSGGEVRTRVRGRVLHVLRTTTGESEGIRNSISPPTSSDEAPMYWKVSMLMTSMTGLTTTVGSWTQIIHKADISGHHMQ